MEIWMTLNPESGLPDYLYLDWPSHDAVVLSTPDISMQHLKTKNIGPLVAIVEHNKQDLVSLGTLFSRLFEEWNL